MVALKFIEIIFLLYFIYVTIYNLYFSLIGFLFSVKIPNKAYKINNILVLIPAYKEDKVIIDVAKDAIKQDYPAKKFKIVVIADSLKSETISKLLKIGVTCLEVSFEHSTKVKSLNKALNSFSSSDFEIALILDADNIMEKGYLKKVNNEYENGSRVIQTQRVAKNLTSSFAILDAISEHVNNNILRKGTSLSQLSCSIIGSGIAINMKLLKEALGEMKSIGGFDRELELKLLAKGFKTKYIQHAKVFDEKVEKAEVFKNQRKRWISSQIIYLKKYFLPGIKMLLKGNLSFFNSAILRNIQLPRVINLGLLFIFFVISIIFPDYLLFNKTFIICFILYLISIILGIPREYYNLKTLKALLFLPRAFFIMILLLFKLKGANKRFIHTPHG